MGRESIVAGVFYPETRLEIISFIEPRIDGLAFLDAKICIAPHAGYVYSGKTAVNTIKHLSRSQSIVLIGPNHTGLGRQVSVYDGDSWATPLGEMRINRDIVDFLCDENLFYRDNVAHQQEHSLEVMLPILKYFNEETKIVPITLGNLRVEQCKAIAERLAQLEKFSPAYLISTDLNHYENNEITLKKDDLAIEQILKLDPIGLLHTITKNQISMCGIIPVMVAIYLANILGLKRAILVEHTTSAKASGDFKRVVGYAGILIK